MKKFLLNRVNQLKKLVSFTQNVISPSPQNKIIIIVGTPHKVGSTWIYRTLKSLNFQSVNIPSHLTEAGGACFLNKDFDFFLQTLPNGRYVFKSHDYPYDFKNIKVNYATIRRDPRDTIVSASFYLANLSPDLGGWGHEFASKSVNERIQDVISKGDFIYKRMDAWYNYSQAFQFQYENLLISPKDQWEQFFEKANIDIKINKLERVIAQNQFSKITGRKKGVEDKSSFFRKGISGDWKNYFVPEVKHFFKEHQNGKWQKLLVNLNYEDSDNW